MSNKNKLDVLKDGFLKTIGNIYDGGKEIAGDIYNGGKEIIGDGVNLVKGTFKDGADVVTSLFNGKNTGKELKEMKNNLLNNTDELLSDSVMHSLNISDDVLEMGVDVFQTQLEVGQELSENEKIDNVLKSAEGFLDKVETVSDNFDEVYKNKEPIIDLLETGVSTILPNVNSENIKTAWNEACKEKDFGSKAETFAKTLLLETGQTMFDDLIKSEAKEKISDSDLTNVQSENGLTNRDLLVLSSFEYSNLVNQKNEGKTIGEILKELHGKLDTDVSYENYEFTAEDIKTLKSEHGLHMGGAATNQDCANLFNEMKNSESLSTLTMVDNTDQEQNYVMATTYVHLDENGEPKSNGTVVFRGTDSAEAWKDDIEGLVEKDTDMQKAADLYVKEQINGKYKLTNLTITGHSKGGNLAMYTTVLNGDNVEKCVSFNGQGFSNKFIEGYQEEINASKNKITAVNAHVDFINSALTSITDNQVYVDATISTTDVNNINKFISDSHSTYTMLDANKDGWTLRDRSDLSKLVGEICFNVEEMKEPLKSEMVDFFTVLADEKLAPKSTVGDRDVQEFGPSIFVYDADLRLRQTANGYNVYTMTSDADNTIATLDINGNITSGNIDAYTNELCPTENAIQDAIINTLNNKENNTSNISEAFHIGKLIKETFDKLDIGEEK